MGADLDLLNHPWLAAVAVVVNTLGHLLVAALVAMIVYEKLGVCILQRAWFNFDLPWAVLPSHPMRRKPHLTWFLVSWDYRERSTDRIFVQ
jgi:hypothetical protein